MKSLLSRLDKLEGHFTVGDEVLGLICQINDPEARGELARRVAGGIGSGNMLNLADTMLFAFGHQGDETEGTQEVTIQ